MRNRLEEPNKQDYPNRELVIQTVEKLQGKSKSEIDDFIENLRNTIQLNYVLKET